MRLKFSRKNPVQFVSALPMLLFFASASMAQPLLQSCAEIADGASRLSCYDEAMKKSQELPVVTSPPVVQEVVPSSGTAQSRAQDNKRVQTLQNTAPVARLATDQDSETSAVSVAAEADDFGLELKQSDNPDNSERTFTVAKARQNNFTGWNIEFSNGQIWKQVGTDPYSIREGESYMVTRASFNSFFLSNSSDNRRMRITRQK